MNKSLTPIEFDRAMEAVIALPKRQQMADAGYALIQEVLGDGMVAYLPALDAFCRRLRQLRWRREYGPPTTASIAEAKRDVGREGDAL